MAKKDKKTPKRLTHIELLCLVAIGSHDLERPIDVHNLITGKTGIAPSGASVGYALERLEARGELLGQGTYYRVTAAGKTRCGAARDSLRAVGK